MDKKSIIILAVCFGLFVAMNSLVPKLFPPIPRPAAPTNAVASASAPGQNNVAPQASAPTASISASTTPVFAVAPNVREELAVLKNENARYTFTSHGGGLKLVELVRYPETVSRRRAETQADRFATLNTRAPAPVLALLGSDGLQEDGVFKLTQSYSTIRAEKTLSNGLTIVKEFQLGTNYLIEASVRIENGTAETITLPTRELVIGTATPMSAEDDGMAVGISWYNGKALESMSSSHFSSRGFMCTPRTPPTEYRAGQSNVVWAAVHNQFFTLVAMPAEPSQEVVTRPIHLPPFPTDAASGAPTRPLQGFQTALVYPQTTLNPGEKFERRIFLFAGPKEYQTLARIGERFRNNLDQVLGFDQMFPFYSLGGFFAKGLLLAMNTLHNALLVGYGWAIIIITVIIKIIFWPLTRASTRSMKRLQALQPQMTAIKEKYKDDPLKAQKKTMEFMKENKVSPLGGCLPMLVQIPVFIAFFTMIRSAIELRGASFLWVADLSMPDTLFYIPGFNFPFNLLPLIMGVTMLWQAQITPVSPGADPMQQKIMKYMPLMFLVFLYNFSAGLTLYWTVQNLLTIAQMKLTKAQPAAVSAVAKPKK